MRGASRPHQSRPLVLLFFLLLAALALPSFSAVTASPALVSIYPTQTSTPIQLGLSFPIPSNGGTFALQVSFPAALAGTVSTQPAPVTYSTSAGDIQGSTSLRFTSSAAAPPGTYSVSIHDPSNGAGTTFVTLIIKQPSFTVAVTPNPLSLVPGGGASAAAAAIAADPGFTTPIQLSFSGFPAGISNDGPKTATLPYLPTTFSWTATAGTAPGTYTGTLTASAGAIVKQAALTIQVSSAPDFSLRASPARLTLRAGTSGGLDLGVVPINGFAGNVSLMTSAPPGVSVTPSSFTLAAGASRHLRVQIGSAVPPSTLSLTFTGSAAGIAGSRSAQVVIEVGAAPDFSLSASPPSLTLRPGQTASARLLVQPFNGFSGTVRLAASSDSALSISPSVFELAAGASRAVEIRVASSAAAGSHLVTWTATAAGANVSHTLALAVMVQPFVPRITVIEPSAMTAGTLHAHLQLTGEHFAPGATVSSASPTVVVDSQRVLSATRAEAVVSVRGDAAAGPYQLTLVNPDGGRSQGGGSLLVYPPGSLAAPFSVTTVAVVSPRPGSLLGPRDSLHPRALLATSGSGTVIGAWLLDGVAFEQFVAQATGGDPVAIVSKTPIPHLGLGAHRLQISIQTPAHVLSPPIEIEETRTAALELRQLGPGDGKILEPGARPHFAWTLVPGTSGYAVEIEDAGGRVRRERIAASRWTPGDSFFAGLAPGAYRWRVLPVYPGAVDGKPSPWSRFVLLPGNVDLQLRSPVVDAASGRIEISWSGGAPGLVALVEVFTAGSPQPLFAALTDQNRLLLPANLPRAKLRVRVTALTPAGAHAGQAETPLESSRLAPRRRRIALAADSDPGEIVPLSPLPASTTHSTQPLISASWSNAVAADDVRLYVDGLEVTSLATVAPLGIQYPSALKLTGGEHRVLLDVAHREKIWRFTVDTAPLRARRRVQESWQVDGELRATSRGDQQGGPPDDAGFTLSSQFGLGAGSLLAKGSAAGTWRKELEGEHASYQDNQDWLVEGGRQGQRRLGLATGGYGAPSSVDQLEFLTAGLARGVAQLALGGGSASGAYYSSFDPKIGGMSSGEIAARQSIHGGALELGGEGKRYDVRVLGFNVDQRGDDLTAGGRGSTFGLFAAFQVTPELHLAFEGARGKFTPDAIGIAEVGGTSTGGRQGNAFRLALEGSHGSMSYQLAYHHLDADFVNPANLGLTPAGRPGQDSIDLGLNATLLGSSLSLQLRRANGGDGFGPPTHLTSAQVSLARPIGQQFSLSWSGNFTQTRGRADLGRGLPSTDRLDWSTGLDLNEQLGLTQISQSLSFARHHDGVAADANSKTMSATLNISRTLGRFTLAGNVSGTRLDAAPTIGRTDTLTVSLQPVLALDKLWLSIAPFASFTKSENAVQRLDQKTELYQFRLTWSPPWRQSLVSLETSSEWTRTRDPFAFEKLGFVRRYSASLVLHWGGQGENSDGAEQPPPPPAYPAAQPPGSALL